MSKYTIELRKVCDIYTRNTVEGWFKDYDLDDFLTSAQQSAITSAGMWTKAKLASKIVDYFYFREIAFETPAMFSHFAKVRMNTIMDKYLPLIYSASLTLNPLEDVNTTHSTSRTLNNSSNMTGQSSSTMSIANSSSGLIVNSNTPQGEISKANILAGEYASSTGANENSGTSYTTDATNTSSTGQNATSESISKTETGNRTSKADLLLKYRKTILNIDDMIMKDLNELFFGLW